MEGQGQRVRLEGPRVADGWLYEVLSLLLTLRPAIVKLLLGGFRRIGFANSGQLRAGLIVWQNLVIVRLETTESCAESDQFPARPISSATWRLYVDSARTGGQAAEVVG